jgi:AcrR family transcriptional regulator
MGATGALRQKAKPGSGDGRAALLQAARQLLSEHGGSRFSVSELAKRAGMNVALVSYYFGGKEQMLKAILEEDEEAILEPLRGLAAADMSAVDKLRRYLSGLVELYVRRPYFLVLTHDLLRRSDDETRKDIAARVIAPTIAFHRVLLAQGKAEGVFREVDPFAFYLNVVGGIDMLFMAKATIEEGFGHRMDDPQLRRRFVQDTVDLVLNGVRPRADESPPAPSQQG